VAGPPQQAEVAREAGADDLLDADRHRGGGRCALGDVPDPSPLLELADSRPEQPDRAVGGAQQAQGQAHERGLARAVRADHRDELAGGDPHRDLTQDRDAAVAEGDLVELQDGLLSHARRLLGLVGRSPVPTTSR
jgi:hypothetical protein